MQQYYEMIGGAASTLLGLLFVSVSLNAETILSEGHTHSRRLAEQAFQNYLAVLIVSLFIMFPEMSRRSQGYTLVSISAIWAGWAAVRLVQTLAHRVPADSTRTILRRYLASMIGFGLVGYAAFYLATSTMDTTIYSAAGTMILLISATIASWELLTNVAEQKYRAHKE